MENLPPGTLVQLQVGAFIEPDNIVFAGMYGLVVDHPHAHIICTPGISTMIQVLGRSYAYGYFNERFKEVQEMPDEEDLETSVFIAQHAFEIFEKEYGYSGFIKMGKKIHPQEKYFKEIYQLSAKIMEWKADEKYSPQIDGNMKRFRKILKAFKNHPLAAEAASLAENLKTVNASSPDIATWMSRLNNWVEEAKKTERTETQSDRITQAKRDGNFETIPYPDPDKED